MRPQQFAEEDLLAQRCGRFESAAASMRPQQFAEEDGAPVPATLPSTRASMRPQQFAEEDRSISSAPMAPYSSFNEASAVR